MTATRAITASMVGRPSGPSSLSASRRPLTGLTGLTAPAGRRGSGHYVMARAHLGPCSHPTHTQEETMNAPTLTPSIAVAIGRQLRVYHAFVTTAPATDDAPSTLTLYRADLADVSGMAADPITVDASRARTPVRLVLVEATELTWQRARCREAQHLFAPADPVLVGANTLQHWLWMRLRAPQPEHTDACAPQ